MLIRSKRDGSGGGMISFSSLFSGSNDERAQLLTHIQKWHEEGENQKIIDAIAEIPEEERGYELTSLLARAFINLAMTTSNKVFYTRAEEILRSVETEGLNDSMWHYRMGYALYYMDREEEALVYLRQASALDPEHSEARNLISVCEQYIERSRDIAPVTIERMQEFFDESGYSYGVEAPQRIRSGFMGNPFGFELHEGECVSMWAAWAPDLPIELRTQLLNVCNERNNNTRCPKAYVQVKDDGSLWVCCEHQMLIRHGCATHQLFQNIFVFIRTASDFFEGLEEQFPQFKQESSQEGSEDSSECAGE